MAPPSAVSSATSTSLDVGLAAATAASRTRASSSTSSSTVITKTTIDQGSDKYKHIFAIHSIARPSTLSHDAQATPSFIGFRNLMVLVLSTKLGAIAVRATVLIDL
jgi:diacylglycerol O-acyltransferase-1